MNVGQKLLIDKFLQRVEVQHDEAIEFFKNTKLAISFVDVLFDNIRFTHKNLPYFVSTQLPNTDTPTLYRSLRNNLVIPVFKKYQYYSPTMMFELVNRICMYVASYYGNQNAFSMKNLEGLVQAQRIKYSDILQDIELRETEQRVWNSMSR